MLAAFYVQNVKETWQLDFLIFGLIQFGRGALHNCYSLLNLSFKLAKIFVIKYLRPTINNLGRQHLLFCRIFPLKAWGKPFLSSQNWLKIILCDCLHQWCRELATLRTNNTQSHRSIPCIVVTRSPPKYSRKLRTTTTRGVSDSQHHWSGESVTRRINDA